MVPSVVSQQLLQVLESLEEITIQMHEALAFEKFEDLPVLAKQRQELITSLGNFDTRSTSSNNISRWSNDSRFRSKLDKLILVGDSLLDACMERLEMLTEARRQRSVIRATVRGYRPHSSSPVSTRKIES